MFEDFLASAVRNKKVALITAAAVAAIALSGSVAWGFPAVANAKEHNAALTAHTHAVDEYEQATQASDDAALAFHAALAEAQINTKPITMGLTIYAVGDQKLLDAVGDSCVKLTELVASFDDSEVDAGAEADADAPTEVVLTPAADVTVDGRSTREIVTLTEKIAEETEALKAETLSVESKTRTITSANQSAAQNITAALVAAYPIGKNLDVSKAPEADRTTFVTALDALWNLNAASSEHAGASTLTEVVATATNYINARAAATALHMQAEAAETAWHDS